MAQILTICMRQVRFEKSHGNRNFGFDLLASVRFGFLKTETEPKFGFRTSLVTISTASDVKERKGKVVNTLSWCLRLYLCRANTVSFKWTFGARPRSCVNTVQQAAR